MTSALTNQLRVFKAYLTQTERVFDDVTRKIGPLDFKQPGSSQKKSIILFYFRAATANFWSLLNNLVWIFGKSLD